MKISLWTEAGIVCTLDIIPFKSPPKILMFGSRTFILMENAGLDENGTIRYTEAFMYVIPELALRNAV